MGIPSGPLGSSGKGLVVCVKQFLLKRHTLTPQITNIFPVSLFFLLLFPPPNAELSTGSQQCTGMVCGPCVWISLKIREFYSGTKKHMPQKSFDPFFEILSRALSRFFPLPKCSQSGIWSMFLGAIFFSALCTWLFAPGQIWPILASPLLGGGSDCFFCHELRK